MPNEPDFYRDTDHRYRADADFHAAVDMLAQLARRHGYSPGELKQIAFKAALNLEMMTAHSYELVDGHYVPRRGR